MSAPVMVLQPSWRARFISSVIPGFVIESQTDMSAVNLSALTGVGSLDFIPMGVTFAIMSKPEGSFVWAKTFPGIVLKALSLFL